MAFLNKKEDVIDIKLTRFGKNLLARGFFKPVYYQFFDDDVVYDSARTGIQESQNASEVRIEQAPILETQPTPLSVERSFDVQENLIQQGNRDKFVKLTVNQDPLERDLSLKYPLHSYRGSTETAPHFQLISHGANFSGSLTYLTSSHFDYKIPQISVDVKYSYIIDRRPTDTPPDESEVLDLLSENIIFRDGTSIRLIKSDTVVELEEASSLYGIENFEVEVFKKKGDGSEDYVKMQNAEDILDLLDINVDKSVKIDNSKRKPNKGFYLR